MQRKKAKREKLFEEQAAAAAQACRLVECVVKVRKQHVTFRVWPSHDRVSPSGSAELSDLAPRRSEGLEARMRDREAPHEPFFESRRRAPIAGGPYGVAHASSGDAARCRLRKPAPRVGPAGGICPRELGQILPLDLLPPRPARWAARRQLRRHPAWRWRRRGLVARASMRRCARACEGARPCAAALRGRRGGAAWPREARDGAAGPRVPGRPPTGRTRGRACLRCVRSCARVRCAIEGESRTGEHSRATRRPCARRPRALVACRCRVHKCHSRSC